MSDISVRVLTADDWQLYKARRLAALADSPEAFAAKYDDEVAFDDEVWQDRMVRAARLLAERDGEAVGIASVRPLEERPLDDETYAEFFGMWVDPAHRGGGVGAALVRAGADQARHERCTHLAYWVGTDNGPAVAFASAYGFRPTDSRRPMTVRGVTPSDESEEETMMVLSLAEDPGVVATSALLH
ncbi:GNAT family N-acetyltransferase [Arsenicicoccus piscis]|uniref:N-acetyltransferase n=2 Tax=Arsenicicoccus piscis TaxID=673954 RepID=A0ABQ6HIA6_9MICO|nr:GNAT family N-acetyltransferase [Arsenicicoccus piscis]GMA18177.1 N-acetyltransferase [Arsenicicoccus piscis]